MDGEKISVKISTENFETVYNGRQNIYEFVDGINVYIGEHKGPAVIYISCIDALADKHGRYKTHPNKLVGTKSCNAIDGVCKIKLKEGRNLLELNSIGIRFAEEDEISSILTARYKRGIDPYKCKLGHVQDIPDFARVRLCFQVVVEKMLLPPVPSKPIKLTKRLKICDANSFTSPIGGNKDMILLCEPVKDDDIAVRFYKEVKGILTWEDFGVFDVEDVHQKCAIKFKTPPFFLDNMLGSVRVYMQLYRPSDGVSSKPLEFTYKGSTRSKKKVPFNRNI